MGNKQNTFAPNETRVLNALRSRGRCSSVELSHILWLSDPRGVISRLRRKGVLIGDEWITSPNGKRYKSYFLINPEKTEISEHGSTGEI